MGGDVSEKAEYEAQDVPNPNEFTDTAIIDGQGSSVRNIETEKLLHPR